ncbi:mucin-like protein isoform X2 [Montipora capricornis]|uniref:mucin-like protein isoform X2 n=1 Tax=Montipora capricornis TaxID=246305 RepID=UPI0035F16317
MSYVERRSIHAEGAHYAPDPPYQLIVYAVVCTPTNGKAGLTVFNVDKNSDRVDVGRLHTGTNYSVEIVALVISYNQTGDVSLRKSQNVYVTTVEGVPLEAPEWIDVKVYLNNTLKMYVKWTAIPSHRVEGKLLGYKVYYHVDGDDEISSVTVGPDVHETTIDIANVPAPYEIRVAGFTRGGIGPMSWPRERLGCQATVISQMGVITSPGFPESTPGGMNCFNAFYPTFTPPVQRFLLVHVVDLLTNRRVEGAPNCTYWQDDYLGWATINPTVILAGPFCGKVQPFAFVSWGNFAQPLSMGFFTGIGPHKREFNSSFFVLYDFSKISVSFISRSGHDAQLSWSASAVEEQIQGCVVLYKRWMQDRKPLWSFKRTLQQNQASLVSLLPLTNYTAWVLCYTSTGKVYGSNTIHFVTTGAPVIRMYPYGESAGDTQLSFTERQCPKIYIPGGGMRFFSKRFRELYICPYGTIQFELDRFNQRPYNFGQRYWLRFSSMIAPYWTRTDLGRSFLNGPSKVFYHIYTGPNYAEILKNATSDVLQSESGSSLPEGKTFNATWVLVVTWVKLRHLELNPIAKKLTNTFQAVLITDNIFTFVMFNYPHNGIQFSAPTSVSLYKYFSDYIGLPVIGFNSGGSKNQYFNLPRSGTLEAEGIDNAIGNAGIPGRWILRIENSSGIEDSDFNCSLWYNNQPDPVRGSLIDTPDPCPCTVFQAFVDNRYTWVEPYFPYTGCFYTVQPVNERGRKCCYYEDAERRGALILDSQPQAGTLDRYHKLRFPEKHQKHDLEAFGYCCLTSRRRAESCKKYYEKRPSEGCEAYVPPQRAPFFGDPHLVTLDGKNYTFNGLGEYVMIDVEKSFFQLQARTKLAKGGGNATVFAAAVAKEENRSTLQCTLKEEGGLEVLINGQIFQEFHSLTNVSFLLNDSVAVSRPQNNSFLVAFPSGISVTVTEIQDSLSIVFAAPSSFQGQTKGLLGLWNGDQQDDFLKPDGTILPSNATGRQIHFNFGVEWQLTDNISLFTYKPGENTSTFSNAFFVPIFLDEPIDFGSDELRTAAELACQGDVNCLFDIASTGDVSVGASTKEVSVQIEIESQALVNFPPEILVGPTEVNVTVNTSATITITAQDPNNDSLIFSVAGNLPAGHTTSTNQTSITISWTVTTAQIEVEFIASDGTANTVHSPIINVCACQNQGVCVQESSDDSNLNNNTGKFSILFCNCLNGYTGSFCEADLDACDENFQPCFPGVSCIDSPPPANASGYTCGPCPRGYSGDGVECSDIDECDTNNGGCDHNCVNTPGSSVCTCNSGYFLNFDGKSCEDVDECQSVSDCMQICENTNGSYNCKCHADFEVDPEDPKNCIPANPCQDNQPGCQHVCYQSNRQENCSCYAGFSLNQDGKTCSDINECASSQPPCSQNCSNTNGSYTCSCVTGFILDSNGQTCNDINECLEFTFQCQDESQKCENTYGSYKCVCEEGLYWIENKCQGLDKGEAPPPPPPAPEPKQPSEEERTQSVNVDIQGLNTSEWNKPKEDAFKQSVAEAATIHCANDNNCISSSSKRKRRSLNNLIFTEDQVHLLPGYPKQVSQVPLLAVIAFYLQTPPGSSSSVINKNVLEIIVKSSVAEISSALNANISNVPLFDKTTTTAQTPEPTSATTTAPTSATISATTSQTTNTSTETTTVPEEEEDPNTMLYAIIVGVVGALVFVIVVSLIVWWLCRGKTREGSPRGEEKNDALGLEMGRVKRSDNIGYYNEAYALPPKVHLERQ